MSAIVELVRKGIIEDATSADSRRVFAMAMALCEPPLADVPAALDAQTELPRFVVRGDEVWDRRTNLIWTRKTIGKYNFANAAKAAAEVKIGGHAWRGPTPHELFSLVDHDRAEPCIDPVFECEAGWYWTTKPLKSSPGDCAWVVGFDNGNAYWNYRNYGGFVRAVRGGQSLAVGA